MSIEQKVLTVPNDDTSINTAITEQAEDGWMVLSIKVYSDDTTVIMLLQKITAI